MKGIVLSLKNKPFRDSKQNEQVYLNGRQSSAWSEAKACLTHLKGNIFFNMPRAAINKNDGFGGGTVIEQNLLTNTCRESGDHVRNPTQPQL